MVNALTIGTENLQRVFCLFFGARSFQSAMFLISCDAKKTNLNKKSSSFQNCFLNWGQSQS